MAPLNEHLRRGLERQVIEARELAERGAEAALARLAVAAKEPHGHLKADDRVLRNRLRARARALGDKLRPSGAQEVEHLTEEVAYDAWHRMLFARFLAENNLLVHPEHSVAVSLAECEELAADEGAEDKWDLAARYASRMLPQIFRPEDASLQVRFAPEHRIALEQLLEAVPREVFTADDSLGWVYQFWQSEKKDEVNAAGEPITGETLPAVTQLFTEPYMVSFLLENTIGAWWTAQHPGEPMPIEMPYLRRLEDGTPAAGAFKGWPATWRGFSLLDPCCGSGHFLVAALRLVVPLRMHDEGLSTSAAVDAVLRQNLYGLELDPRCTQIAAFAVAFAAWTYPGTAGYRPLPELQIACSGLSVGAKREEWLALVEGHQKLQAALGRLYDLFKLAPELGSLIDPTAGGEDLLAASFAEVQPLLEKALRSERVKRDEQLEAAAVTAQGIAKAAELLGRKYSLVATNVPYLTRNKQSAVLQRFSDANFSDAKQDLASTFLARCTAFLAPSGTAALVAPQYIWFLQAYSKFRKRLLVTTEFNAIARLGSGAFETIGGSVVNVALFVLSNQSVPANNRMLAVDASQPGSPEGKAKALKVSAGFFPSQQEQLDNPEHRLSVEGALKRRLLGEYATSHEGLSRGDSEAFDRYFWELKQIDVAVWSRLVNSPSVTSPYSGRELVFLWEQGRGRLAASEGARIVGAEAWGRKGVFVARTSDLKCTLTLGEIHAQNGAVLIPRRDEWRSALWAFAESGELNKSVRAFNQKIIIPTGAITQVPFDLEHWTKVAEERYPNGLPAPHSDDPTQWLFAGDIPGSTEPLQVAVARLIGYRWPDQTPDAKLDALSDDDGIVCLPAVRGETPAADRLQALLGAAYGTEWASATRDRLLADVGFEGKTLAEWLQDGFFEQHTKLFHQRPFIWHITDKAKGGFSALVNYHRLDRKTLEALTYNYLGDWIARQKEAKKRDERGADVRLAAAKALQAELELILEGEPPYDTFVRWKALHEQPIGWNPDLNDGVRVNIWPFVQAGVLRAKVNVNWNRDRGKNPEGSFWGPERYNRFEDIPPEDRPEELRDVEHLTNEIKLAARAEHQSPAKAKPIRKPTGSRR